MVDRLARVIGYRPCHGRPSPAHTGSLPRARELGILFDGAPGPWNAITDVPGVEVGYATLIEGEDVRTGVTAIHPRGRANPYDPCAAGVYSLNGNGEMTGYVWVEESGTISLPITITSTAAVGLAHAGTVSWVASRHPDPDDVWVLPVAAETWDGFLHDIYGRRITEQEVHHALDSAVSGPASRTTPSSLRRSSRISSTVAGGVAFGTVFGRRDRGSNAASPSAR